MSGVETVDDDFEVGFNQTFESHWYRAEQAGRVVMVLFTQAAGPGLLGRGPYSHATARSADGALTVDYEPIARHHSTSTTLTVHIKQRWDVPHPVELRINQTNIEPLVSAQHFNAR